MQKIRVRSLRSRRFTRRATVAGGLCLLLIASVTGLTTATAEPRHSDRFCRRHQGNEWCKNHRPNLITVPSNPSTTDGPAPTTAPTTTPPTTAPPPTTTPTTAPPVRNTCATKVAGVTIDNVDGIWRTASALALMPRYPTTRVVFDENVNASYYVAPLAAIAPVSHTMGELLDSSYVRGISTADYVARQRSYLTTLGNLVDIWEVGNEVNGNWLGSYGDVSAKIRGAYDVVNNAGKKTALTLYYNPNGLDGPGEPTPEEFSQQYVPADMRAGLDYVWVSYYETDFRNYRPSAAVLTAMFQRLHALYPNAVLGFGEIGLSRPATESTLSQARSIMSYYYGLSIPLPYYCGGYFWWYGAQDVFKEGALMPSHFDAALDSMP